MQLCSSHSSECTIKICQLYPHIPCLKAEVSLSLLYFISS